MSEEIENKAVELADEEIENAAGGVKNQLHTCSIYAQIVPGVNTMDSAYCKYTCQYKCNCSGGQTEVSNDDIMKAWWAFMDTLG